MREFYNNIWSYYVLICKFRNTIIIIIDTSLHGFRSRWSIHSFIIIFLPMLIIF